MYLVFVNRNDMEQGMEPDVKKFLMKVLHSLAYGLLWLAINALVGLYWGYGIIEGRFSVLNLIYFVWLVISLAALIYYYYRQWGK